MVALARLHPERDFVSHGIKKVGPSILLTTKSRALRGKGGFLGRRWPG
jgi:hypothetical protein